MTTEWRSVPGWPAYRVSSVGELAGPRGTIKGHLLNSGYIGCTLNSAGVRRSTTVQRLVLEAFVGPAPSAEHEANHKNGIKRDNRPENLEWLTPAENKLHAKTELDRAGGRPRTRPILPPRPPAGSDLEPAVLIFRGQRVEVPLRQPGWKARSDQVAALIDGQWTLTTARALALRMAADLPRQITRQQRAELF